MQKHLLKYLLMFVVFSLLPAISLAQDAVITEDLRAYLERNSFAAARSGSILYIYYHNDEAESVALGGTFSLEMNEQEPGIWTSVFSMDELDTALFTFALTPAPGGYTERYFYRGPRAQARVSKADVLQGRFHHENFRSVLLGTQRQITVYLPPAPAQHVIFMGDGLLVRKLADYVEPLIRAQVIPPVAIAGSHPGAGISRENGGLAYRDLEYLEGVHEFAEGATDGPFKAHLAYFLDEFIPRVIRTHSLPAEPERHSLAGFSNSAAFAISLAKRHPDRFENLLLFSPIWQPALKLDPPDSAPTLYLAYGSLEGDVTELIKSFATRWSGENNTTVHEITAGHDEIIWLESFYRFVKELEY